MRDKKNIILGVSASIAIYKACDILRKLINCGYNVTVVMTAEAEELIRPIVFQSLSGNKVYRGNLFAAGKSWEIEHISLADKADMILVAPATANILAKVASGISDDLLSCAICATKAPVLFAPAMNENMFNNKITQANIAKLKSFGYKFIAVGRGKLACGKVGIGCLAATDDILAQVNKILG
ncbi:MAG: hypothetical protein M0Q96_02940 [Candidatus Omnitrophica bacterium]|jgi:phosphopantothenoylcysteine decarboxylase/phosphopantothenate--cysteine ligase|nr:hypothetical protein [Candidatus Omnitrophota bacterium]